MRARRLARALTLGLTLLLATSAVASDSIEDAEQAVRERRFVDAVRIWQTLAERGSPEAAYRLGTAYRSGRGVARDDSTATSWLAEASGKGHPEAQYNLATMYQNGWGVALDRERALHWYTEAARRGHVMAGQKLDALNEPGGAAAIDPARSGALRLTGEQRLHRAIEVDDLNGAKRALEAGAQLEAAGSAGRTPLTDAIDRDRSALVDLLLDAGAAADHVDAHGDTPLMVATRSGNTGMIDKLLAHNADVNLADARGATPLMLAAQLGEHAAAAALIEGGADPNLRDREGRSPLEAAVAFAYADLAKLLVRAGAETRKPAGGAQQAELAWLNAGAQTDDTAGNHAYAGWPPLAVAASQGKAGERSARFCRPDPRSMRAARMASPHSRGRCSKTTL